MNSDPSRRCEVGFGGHAYDRVNAATSYLRILGQGTADLERRATMAPARLSRARRSGSGGGHPLHRSALAPLRPAAGACQELAFARAGGARPREICGMLPSE